MAWADGAEMYAAFGDMLPALSAVCSCVHFPALADGRLVVPAQLTVTDAQLVGQA